MNYEDTHLTDKPGGEAVGKCKETLPFRTGKQGRGTAVAAQQPF